jgi:NAD(P)-dependent dehydrogenase (short-subunit alcohol dehydrogenase family)
MKIAVITGASSGIGRGTASLLAARGVSVVLTYRSNPAGAEEAIAEIEAAGGQALALRLDMADSTGFDRFKEQVVDEIGRRWERSTIDYLVNNAGFGQPSMIEETSEELLDTFYRIHVKGPYFLAQKLLPTIEDGGAIVNTVSSTGFRRGVEEGYSAYGTMKGALALLTRYQAKEFSPRGIRVNSVSPGPTRTGMSDSAFAEYPEVLQGLVDRTALGRIGEPEDVGRVITMLLSEEAAWITGENIEASGGYDL